MLKIEMTVSLQELTEPKTIALRNVRPEWNTLKSSGA